MNNQRGKTPGVVFPPKKLDPCLRSADANIETEYKSPRVDLRRLRGSKLSRKVLTNSNPEDLASVKGWEQKALAQLECSSPKTAERSLRLLFDAAEYYESIGLHENALQSTTSILRFSTKCNDLALQRRAHSALSAYHCRVCDFNTAFQHAESSYVLSLRMKDPVSKLVTLINTAVILDSVGLSEEAKSLAHVASQISPTSCNELIVHLHLTNASNALRFSRNVGDADSADYFFRTALKHFRRNSRLFTEMTRTFYEAFTAEHLISTGNAGVAVANLESALVRNERNHNPRIAAILYGSLVEGYSALGNSRRVDDCEQQLLGLLPEEERLRSEDEDLFRVLINLTRRRNNAGDAEKQAELTRRLQRHLMISRHRFFFDAIARSYANGYEENHVLRAPVYATPQWLLNVEGCAAQATQYVDSAVIDKSSEGLQYSVAEDWAIAAEFYSGGSWEHCFRVGELVRLMALECHLSPEEAQRIGLAARLHDIGKIATVEEMFKRDGNVPLNYVGRMFRHSEVGFSLLSNCSALLLQLAGRIAGGHHEWWNGGGLPRGLRGESIPFEARLCAVADTFLEYCKPRVGFRWSTATASEQLLSMAGVQLDPQLVDILIRIVRASDGDKGCEVKEQEARQDGLLRTKKSLFEKLELAE